MYYACNMTRHGWRYHHGQIQDSRQATEILDEMIEELRQACHPTSLTHTPFNGTPTTTGALHASPIGTGVSSLGVPPTAASYPSDGQLHDSQPGPYIPAGGIGTGGETPVYNAKSDFDYESLALAFYQEYTELDLFHDGLARFSVEEFTAAGLTAEDRFLIEFMARPGASRMRTYNYPYTTVHEFVDFCQKLTRFGESGVYGFLSHLNSREAAILLLQSITTEARQQMIFRQFEGLFPMPVWFEVGVPQPWAWTLLAPYISSCPENRPGGVNSLNSTAVPSDASCVNSTTLGFSCYTAIIHNRTQPLYLTSTSAGDPKYVVWVTQLNVTYSPLEMTGDNRGSTIQPDVQAYARDPAVNGTMFIAITDSDPYLSPFNLSMINPHVVAGPALYQSG
ncbi:hypothetical protein BDV40DRAFT_286258 [Aspergillus tamarii]|uniref:Uncharacterized protein n=1 Tax=Aspergillus tamarii TaxID=41984 RepID=A0A5N6V2X8_ASPTM|nr:hypothetical protein BDV40DRAFT_286258 [Aspergillus tamarii]